MGALTAGEIANKAARFTAAVILARALSLDDYGLLNVGIAISGLLFVACGLGLPETGSREVSVAPARAPEIVDRVLTGRLLVLGAISAVLLLAVAAIAPDDVPIVAFAVVMAAALACSLDWLLRGLERMGAVAAAGSAGGLVVLAGSAVIVTAKPTAAAALAVFIVGEATVALVALRASRLPRLPRLRRAGLRSAVRRSWPLGAGALVVYSYYANLDTIVLSIARSPEEAGLYSAPYRLFLALNVIGTFAAYAMMPRIARAVASGQAEDDAAMAGLRRALIPFAGYGLVVLGAVEIVGDDVLGVLFGTPFAGQGAVLIVLCIAVPWYTVAFPVAYALIARQAHRRFFGGAATAGVLNIVLNLALIPPFGPAGAAVATTIALVAGSLVWLIAHDMRDRRSARVVGAVCAGSLGALVVLGIDASASAIGGLTAACGLFALLIGVRDARRRQDA